MRHRVCHHYPAQLTAIDGLAGLAAENAVGDNGHNLTGTIVYQNTRSLDECSASVSHVVDEDGDLVLDVSDEDHAGDFVGAGAFLVDEGKVEVETVGDRGGTG